MTDAHFLTDAVLTVDIGTSTMKCGIITFDGRLLQEVREPLPAFRGHHHIDPADGWLDAIAASVKKLASRGLMSYVSAVCIGGNGPTIVPVAADGRRCGDTVLWSSRLIGSYKAAGTPSFFLPAAASIMAEQAQAAEAVRYFAGCPEYLAGVLTGEWRSFLPSSSFMPYMWDRKQLEIYDIPEYLMPPFAALGEPVGEVTKTGSEISGIPHGVPLIAGGPDYLMALLGNAVINDGDACDRAGTSEALNVCKPQGFSSGRREYRKKNEIRVLPHAAAGMESHAVILPVTGHIFMSCMRLLGIPEAEYEVRIHDILHPEWVDGLRVSRDTLEAASNIMTQESQEPGTAETGSRQIETMHGDPLIVGRKIAEAAGFEIRRGIEILASYGISPASLRIAGGQVRNRRWNQLKANITGMQIEVPEIIDAELGGAAAAAMYGMGIYSSLEDACRAVYSVHEMIYPDADLHERFSERYQLFTNS